MFHRYMALSESFLILIFTSFGIWIIFKTKRRIRNQDYSSKKFSINQLLILALFCAHFMVGLMRLGYHFTSLYDKSKKLPRIFSASMVLSCGFEVLYTTIIPVERYLSIRFPFHSALKEKLYRKIYFILSPLFLTAFFALTMFYTGFILPFAVIVLGILVILVCNLLLYGIVNKQNKHIDSTMVHGSSVKEKEEKDRRRKIQNRSFKICALMTLTYVFLWVPYIAFTFILETNKELLMYYHFISFLAYLNPIIDVLIYMIWNKEMRRTLSMQFRKKSTNEDVKERRVRSQTVVTVDTEI